MDAVVKRETEEPTFPPPLEMTIFRSKISSSGGLSVFDTISLSSSSYDSGDSDDSDDSDEEEVLGSATVDGGPKKKRKLGDLGVVLPVGFLDPLPSKEIPLAAVPQPPLSVASSCKQFWKAGDYEGAPTGDWDAFSGGVDHVRVHPKFLHSNATSHKWALGAFAELLDNALDEACHGATFVNINMLIKKKDKSRMLLIEDNGGGMDPDKMRHCMSLGYSAKSKSANTIGQYGNGFKTSTMRLGADVIVFSCCHGIDGKSPNRSIGLLSYTFLRSTGKEDIIVPMLDYEKRAGEWKNIMRSSPVDWNRNLETIIRWSPFTSESDLPGQFHTMKDQGTRIIIYNLWEDDQGLCELDFDADPHDIQIRGVNRDEKNIKMAKQYPNSKHFLTYQHSLRSYAAILYLRLPPGFRIILRGKDVEHHNIVNDLMLTQEVTYRPQPGADGMVAVVTMGFVKDAKFHIDVQGFNVYHKNRLIKPFWRVWNAAGSDGRGVIGVLEANFVEPAHDKQGFERTTVLSRLEARLVQMQKTYWSTNCHLIGYAPRVNKKLLDSSDRESSPDYNQRASKKTQKKYTGSSNNALPANSKKLSTHSNQELRGDSKGSSKRKDSTHENGHIYDKIGSLTKKTPKPGNRRDSPEQLSPSEDASDGDGQTHLPDKLVNGGHQASPVTRSLRNRGSLATPSKGFIGNGIEDPPSNSTSDTSEQLKEENRSLKERLKKRDDEILGDLLRELQYERDRCVSLENQLQEARQKILELNKEQESLIDIFSEERERRDTEEDNLRKKLKDASNTIQDLLHKVKLLERIKSSN
ncbi:hypothetical protein RJ641_014156 [Dillenia turbinata]|uniref:Morc S5 domain-containing protein n=1 Tax=Dillenia turbinata TaxID=194707 RepID=A0AAN8Z4L4_9MAGN